MEAVYLYPLYPPRAPTPTLLSCSPTAPPAPTGSTHCEAAAALPLTHRPPSSHRVRPLRLPGLKAKPGRAWMPLTFECAVPIVRLSEFPPGHLKGWPL